MAAAVGAGIAGCAGAPAAVVNKVLADHGRHDAAGTPARLVSTLFRGSSHVNTFMQVITALVLLTALMALIFGIGRVFRGDRGGLEVMASGAFGLVGLIAAITVIM